MYVLVHAVCLHAINTVTTASMELNYLSYHSSFIFERTLACYMHVYLHVTAVTSWISSHGLSYLPIPKYIAQGQHYHAGLSYRFLVMNCFGEDIEKKFNQCKRKFGIKTVCHLALRIVSFFMYYLLYKN